MLARVWARAPWQIRQQVGGAEAVKVGDHGGPEGADRSHRDHAIAPPGIDGSEKAGGTRG